jgi:hypothetical protein
MVTTVYARRLLAAATEKSKGNIFADRGYAIIARMIDVTTLHNTLEALAAGL